MVQHPMSAYDGQEKYIFVSYAHKDDSIVYPIMAELVRQGYRIWYDEGITPGSEWPEDIALHLNNSAMVIAFVSANSMASVNCRREINFSLSKQKPFLSVVLEPTDMPLGMELQLSAQQSIFRYNYATEDRFIEKICACPDIACCKQLPEVREEPQSAVPDPEALAAPVKEPFPAADAPASEPPVTTEPAPAAKSGKKTSMVIGIAVAAVLLLILCVALGTGANAGKTDSVDTITVRVDPLGDWQNVYLWAWTDGRDAFEQWPGTAMEPDGGWYVLEVPNWITGVVISNGDVQSGDLTVEAGKDLWIVERENWWIAFYEVPTEQLIQTTLAELNAQ